MTQISQKKIKTDKINSWWKNLNSFERKELYKYWEGKDVRTK